MSVPNPTDLLAPTQHLSLQPPPSTSPPAPSTAAAALGALSPLEALSPLVGVPGADAALPIFEVERVQLQFSVAAEFVAAQVANNVLVLALSNARILRIDLNKPEDIDDIDLPRKSSSSEAGATIRRMFLDPTASHLLIATSAGDTYYLHAQSKQPRLLGRLRGIAVQSVAWNPALPTTSTREILVGTADGAVYEVCVDGASRDFYNHKKEVKLLKLLYQLPSPPHEPIVGVWVDTLGHSMKHDLRRILIATPHQLLHLSGKIGSGQDNHGSVYTRLFEKEHPIVHELRPSSHGSSGTLNNTMSSNQNYNNNNNNSNHSSNHSGSIPVSASFAITPDPISTSRSPLYAAPEDAVERAFAWLSSQGGILYGRLMNGTPGADLGTKVFAEAKMASRAQLDSVDESGRRRATSEPIDAIALTQWHVIGLLGTRLVALNRLTGEFVFEQTVLEPGQKALGIVADAQKNTFFLVTHNEILELVVRDEDRRIWEIYTRMHHFSLAYQHARTPAQKEIVATAHGDHLLRQNQIMEAAIMYAQSHKPFEDVALRLIDSKHPDALRHYLLTKLAATKKSAVMQRVMMASWLVELFMVKLNGLEDASLSEATATAEKGPFLKTQHQRKQVQKEYQTFVTKYQDDLDRRTVYDIVGSHGREEELLFYATTIGDYDFTLSYWVQRARWQEALAVLKKQTAPDAFYKYCGVLLSQRPAETVDVLTRHDELDPKKLIPALLEYTQNYTGPVTQNQAVRYLQHVIHQFGSTDPAIHSTLLSIYASHPSPDESALLAYLRQYSDRGSSSRGGSDGQPPYYDADFALRLCIEHHRTLACVHIYTSMGQYTHAVDLALSHDEVEVAASIADRVESPGLRKRLWLSIARKVIVQASSIKSALDFLKRCDLLRMEDLIPFFPDFVVIDDFKEEICAALEDYSRTIDTLRREMDESSQTAETIRREIAALDQRFALIEPGEPCYACRLPLLRRPFFVFPCQHAFHSDCLSRRVLARASPATASRIRDLQNQLVKGSQGALRLPEAKREAVVQELDGLVAASCILCGDFAIRRIDEPFLTPHDDLAAWAVV